MTVSYWHLLIVLLSLIPFSFLVFFKKSLTASIVQIFFAWRIRILTNNWYYVAFIIAAAVLGGGDVCRHNLFFSLSYHTLKKTTACSIVVAYVARFNPQFNEFRAFKVPFPLVVRHSLRLLILVLLFSGRGHLRICIRNARKHHDNQRFGVVFVSSLQQSVKCCIDSGFSCSIRVRHHQL